MKTIYECEVCGRNDFESEEECSRHESAHTAEEVISFLGGRICPACEGEGGHYGNDGVDWRMCHLCKGKKVVSRCSTGFVPIY